MLYITSVYWAVTISMTVGYGDLLPISTFETLLVCAILIVGVALFSYFVGAMSNGFSSLNTSVSKQKVKNSFII